MKITKEVIKNRQSRDNIEHKTQNRKHRSHQNKTGMKPCARKRYLTVSSSCLYVLFTLCVCVCVQWCPTHIVLCICFVFRLIYVMCVCLCIVVSNTYCVVSLFCFCLIYVMCVCLCIVASNTYCVVLLFCFSSSCVLCVASCSGLSIFDCSLTFNYSSCLPLSQILSDQAKQKYTQTGFNSQK